MVGLFIKRLRLDEYMATQKDENGQPISANWVAKKVGVSHNTIMYYKEHYLDDLNRNGRIRQPSYTLVKGLCQLFGIKEEEFVEWEVSQHSDSFREKGKADKLDVGGEKPSPEGTPSGNRYRTSPSKLTVAATFGQ